MVASAIRFHLPVLMPEPVLVNGVDRPRRLARLPDDPPVTHAVIDLSYGRDDMDGPALRPERETGTDAVDLVHTRWPDCAVVVATRNDTELLTETAVAIRQTWPGIQFLHKADERLVDQIAAFVQGRHHQDNAEIALDLIGVEPVAPARLADAVRTTCRARPTARLLLSLADQPQSPPRRQVAAELGMGDNYVRSLAHDLSTELRRRELLVGDRGGLDRLWLFARARRAVLCRALRPLVD